MGYAPNNAPFSSKPKTPPPPKKDNPAKDTICHQCGEGLRGSKKLKPGALSMYVGDGHRAAIEAIRTYHLDLPSGLFIVLNNCHYAPSITSGVISVSRLFDDGFINRFDDNNVISVSNNNLVYFNHVPQDGIFEIDMSCSNINDSSMYTITNKRAKINLDSSLLWHCRLGHISKKHIEKLQHDGLLNSIDIESFRKCVSCMSVKMARKSYSHQVERAKDLLRLIHTNVCGPFKIMSRQGVSYFVTFTNDFSCYGYVYLLKHKHEVFQTFKIFQKEIENQLGKTIKSLRSDRGGYPKKTMGYSFYSPFENKVFVARNAEFFESKLLDLKASGSVEDLELIPEEDTNPSVDTSLDHGEDDQEIDEPQSDINPIRKSSRTRHAPDRMCLYIDAEEHELGDLGEPANYKAALMDLESKKWLDAMNVEMQSMKDNDVWVLVELPPNARTVGSKWLFNKKTDMDGAVYIFKARLVAKVFTQTYGVDYEETSSPVADIRAIRILIAIATYYDYEIWQMDIKTAFLNGHLSEEVYMEQLEGFVNPKYPNHVCKLKRFIYGLKQASRSFAMKDLGDAAYTLGIKIYRDRSKQLIGLCQRAYIEKILKRYYMENSKRGTIPMQENLKLSKSQGASTPTKKQQHWTAVKNILKYLRNTKDMFSVYGGNMERELRVSCYTDAGYLTDADNLKSQTGYVCEYIAAFDASKEVVWIRKFIFGLGIVPIIEEPISMYYDNTGAIAIAKDGVTKGARHFHTKVHYLRETIKLADHNNKTLTKGALVFSFKSLPSSTKPFKLVTYLKRGLRTQTGAARRGIFCTEPFCISFVVKVGAQTETKLKEKKHKVEDALNATKEGAVVGGGFMLLRIAAKVDSINETFGNDEPEVGSDIVKRALGYSVKLIANNADCKECWSITLGNCHP
nr:retrotransposon protein, putative, Ty1-copia subclass [Tanacetum cinerariifolium]